NFAKSTLGQGSRPSAAPSAPPPAAAPAASAPWASALLTNARTSACVLRCFLPLPLTLCSSTPSSRANLRTDGDACGTGAAVSAASNTTGDLRCACPGGASGRGGDPSEMVWLDCCSALSDAASSGSAVCAGLSACVASG